jgi:hypothetical protein
LFFPFSDTFWCDSLPDAISAKFDYWAADAEFCASLGLDTSRTALFPEENGIDLRGCISMLPMFKRVTASTGIVLRQEFYNDIKVSCHTCFG